MTRRDFIIKWALYALVLIPIWFFDTMVLNHFPLFGVSPTLLPLAAVVVAVLEGPVPGAGFGLAVGILCDAVYYGTGGAMTLALTLISWGAGAAALYVLDRGFLGSLFCCAVALLTLGGGRVFVGMFTGLAPFPVLLRVAVPELLWSLCFVVPIYPMFSATQRKIIRLLRL